MPITIMKWLPSGGLLVNRFAVGDLGMQAEFDSEWGTFTFPIASGSHRTYRGRIERDDKLVNQEVVALIIDNDINGVIAELNLCEFGGAIAQEALRALLQE